MPGGSAYQHSQSVMNTPGESGAAYKKRLSNFLGEDDSSIDESDNMTKEDMLKLAKDKKKVAKANLNFKKKM